MQNGIPNAKENKNAHSCKRNEQLSAAILMAILKGNISVILSRKHVHFWTSKEKHLNKLPFLFMFKYERKKSMTGFKRNKNRIVVNQFTKIYLPKYWHSRYVEGLENNLSNLILSSFLVSIRFWMKEKEKPLKTENLAKDGAGETR